MRYFERWMKWKKMHDVFSHIYPRNAPLYVTVLRVFSRRRIDKMRIVNKFDKKRKEGDISSGSLTQTRIRLFQVIIFVFLSLLHIACETEKPQTYFICSRQKKETTRSRCVCNFLSSITMMKKASYQRRASPTPGQKNSQNYFKEKSIFMSSGR